MIHVHVRRTLYVLIINNNISIFRLIENKITDLLLRVHVTVWGQVMGSSNGSSDVVINAESCIYILLYNIDII